MPPARKPTTTLPVAEVTPAAEGGCDCDCHHHHHHHHLSTVIALLALTLALAALLVAAASFSNNNNSWNGFHHQRQFMPYGGYGSGEVNPGGPIIEGGGVSTGPVQPQTSTRSGGITGQGATGLFGRGSSTSSAPSTASN